MNFRRGVRGTALESLIEYTNMKYHNMGLLRIDKVATPVKALAFQDGMITKGYYEKKSTVDFVGIIQGVFVAFDAKETENKSLPLQNIHPHQVNYMKDVNAQGGLAFLIVHFKSMDRYYLVPYEILSKLYYDNTRKSIPHSEMKDCIEINLGDDGTLRYLDALNEMLSNE